MGLNPQTIGTSFPHGYAGSYARQPDQIIPTLKSGEATANIPFGAAVFYDSYGNVTLPTNSATAQGFAGIAAAEIKTNLGYLSENGGYYAPGDIMPVMARGRVNVKCQRGTAAFRGTVYVRIATNASYPTAVVGGLEASSDSTNTIALANAVWGGTADANGIAELIILSLLIPAAAESYTLPAATTSALGGVKQGVAVADAASTAPTAAEFKALLDSLRTSGAIATAT